MRRSQNSYFPDVTVWLALTYRGHVHQAAAWAWVASVGPEFRLCFCRLTQMGLLRLLTTESVMGRNEVMNQKQAWAAYDRWLEDDRIEFLDEPPEMDQQFRLLTATTQASPKAWVEGYLAAFATLAGLPLVTFDQGLRGKLQNLLLLKP